MTMTMAGRNNDNGLIGVKRKIFLIPELNNFWNPSSRETEAGGPL